MTDNVKNSQFQPPANFNSMSDEQKKQTYTEWAKEKYAQQYESWMPWIEDNFLKYFTKDNKASYATKRELFDYCLFSFGLSSPQHPSWTGWIAFCDSKQKWRIP
jgi:hypothetical protein